MSCEFWSTVLWIEMPSVECRMIFGLVSYGFNKPSVKCRVNFGQLYYYLKMALVECRMKIRSCVLRTEYKPSV